MHVTIIIATSSKRTDWLINRSLKSVYNQEKLKKEDISILIVDDNEDKNEFENIISQVKKLRSHLSLNDNEFHTQVIRNKRTRFMSGTGAWNTGIGETYNQYPNSFIAILDDDDAFLPLHLSDCLTEVTEETLAVFQRLQWINEDGTELHFPLTLQDLTPERFFIGNPGIQGSNMFFRTKALIDIGGFDENLPNTTDRDLMIRFLQHIEKSNYQLSIKVIETIGVTHYNHKRYKVNNAFETKRMGLDLFYQKHRNDFSTHAYQKSLLRAQRFFNYISPQNR